MTPEEHQMLKETYELAQRNAVILEGIQRSNRVSTFLKVLYWAFIIAATFGAFYVIQPYIDALKASLGDFGGTNISSLIGK